MMACLKSGLSNYILVKFLLATFICCSTNDVSFDSGTVGSPDEAMNRLLQVFGMDHVGKKHHRHGPPQYMVDLYNAIADSYGISKSTQPYRSNIVRSFSRKNVGHQQIFYFDLSSIPSEEEILEAEFHFYKMKERRDIDKKALISHVFEVRIYQIMHPNSTFTEENNLLLNVRKLSTHSSGWEVFNIKQTAKDWLKLPKSNYGLLLTIRNSFGKQAEFNSVNFARNHRHDKRQPLLVIFTDDHKQRKFTKELQFNKGIVAFPYMQADYSASVLNFSNTIGNNEMFEKRLTRAERAVDDTGGCTRRELNVDFEKLGWSSWIISPKWYNAYFCKGNCAFPLGQNQWPTNHATVQSIVHELNLVAGIGTPSCVPNKLYSINLLYFDENENVILKRYDDMVAASCGCH